MSSYIRCIVVFLNFNLTTYYVFLCNVKDPVPKILYRVLKFSCVDEIKSLDIMKVVLFINLFMKSFNSPLLFMSYVMNDS